VSKKLSYHDSVNYEAADPAKVLAQKHASATAKNIPFNFKEIKSSRGESAYVFDMGAMYGALVQEGLGTKSLIAQSIYTETGKSFFSAVAKDTVATFINDLISVGATPVVTNAYWSSSSYDWLTDKKLTTDFIKGWKAACDEAKVVWGGGETQSLTGIISEGALEFAGTAFGVISPKSEMITYKNLQAGDKIIFVESSGVHANGISLIRKIASGLKEGYQTKLADGKELGETALIPTHLYSKMIRKLFEAGINIHYLSNITGHGWRKLMRASSSFTYEIDLVPPYQTVFDFIANRSGSNNREMYGTFNMGVGYAIYLPESEVEQANTMIKKMGLKSWTSGTVKKGPKQVIIKPLNLKFSEKELGVRE
jgi:phosphoribosylformylglycinamidine cyclo-ligase